MGDSPFEGLAGKAKVKVETGAALEAARACSSAIEVFKGCRDLFDAHGLNNYDEAKLGGSQVDAGPPLRNKFITEATQAKDLIGRYIDSLEDLVTMFKAAGDSYTETDEGSGDNIAALKSDLEQVKSSPGARDLQSNVDTAGSYKPANYDDGDHDYDIGTASVPKHVGTATAEPVGVRIPVRAADNMSWRDMYDLGQRISWQEVADDAPIWEAMAQAVHSAAYDLEQKLGEITSDRWESQGGDAAFTAISTFGASAMVASDSFTMMQQNLEYTANWLYATKVCMPIDKEDKCDDDLQENRDRYERHYVRGVTNTEKLFPAAAEPAAPKGPVTTPDDNNNNNNNGNNNNGNNNAGNNSGGAGNSGGTGNSGGAGNSGGSGNSGGGSQQQAIAPDVAKQQAAQQAAQEAAAALRQTGANGAEQGANGRTSGSTGTAGSPAGAIGSVAGSSGSGAGEMSGVLSSVMSAVTGAVSSLTQALPSLATALQQVSADIGGAGAAPGLPDFTQLGNLFGQFPDLAEMLSQSPELHQLIADNPALSPLAELLGIETDATGTGEANADGAAVGETTESAAGEMFPRASLPDFSNLSGLGEVVAPLTGLVAESLATEAPAQVLEAPVESVEVGSTGSIAHARPEAQA